MITVLVIMTIGMLTGYLIHKKSILLKINNKLLTFSIYFLLFLLGIKIGLNDKIVNNIHNLGFQAVIITIGALLGSLICAYITYKLFFSDNSNKK